MPVQNCADSSGQLHAVPKSSTVWTTTGVCMTVLAKTIPEQKDLDLNKPLTACFPDNQGQHMRLQLPSTSQNIQKTAKNRIKNPLPAQLEMNQGE